MTWLGARIKAGEERVVLEAVRAGKSRHFQIRDSHDVRAVFLGRYESYFRAIDRTLQRLRRHKLIVFDNTNGWRATALGDSVAEDKVL